MDNLVQSQSQSKININCNNFNGNLNSFDYGLTTKHKEKMMKLYSSVGQLAQYNNNNNNDNPFKIIPTVCNTKK
tara:strand:+ start:659 stop:880 length:222 start_codon:yes stop_codon:yes gene_type:complete